MTKLIVRGKFTSLDLSIIFFKLEPLPEIKIQAFFLPFK